MWYEGRNNCPYAHWHGGRGASECIFVCKSGRVLHTKHKEEKPPCPGPDNGIYTSRHFVLPQAYSNVQKSSPESLHQILNAFPGAFLASTYLHNYDFGTPPIWQTDMAIWTALTDVLVHSQPGPKWPCDHALHYIGWSILTPGIYVLGKALWLFP